MNSANYFLFLLSHEGSVDRTCHIVLLAEFASILTLDQTASTLAAMALPSRNKTC